MLWGRRPARGWRPASSSRPSPPSAYRLALRAWVAACLAPRVAWLAPRVAGPRAGAQPGGEEKQVYTLSIGEYTDRVLTRTLVKRRMRRAATPARGVPRSAPTTPSACAKSRGTEPCDAPATHLAAHAAGQGAKSRRPRKSVVGRRGSSDQAWLSSTSPFRRGRFSFPGGRPPTAPVCPGAGARPTCRDGPRACGRGPRPARPTPGRSAGWQTTQAT